jgi:hypothetical protein
MATNSLLTSRLDSCLLGMLHAQDISVAILELLTRFLASWIAGAKSQKGENPNGGEDRPVCFAYAMR